MIEVLLQDGEACPHLVGRARISGLFFWIPVIPTVYHACRSTTPWMAPVSLGLAAPRSQLGESGRLRRCLRGLSGGHADHGVHVSAATSDFAVPDPST